MIKIEKIYPRDLIAALVLIGSFILLALGVDSYFTGLVTLVIGYYFSKRVYEENNPNGDLTKVLKQVVKKLK